MLDILIHIFICSFIIHGVHAATRGGMVFGFVEDYFSGKGWPWWADPLTECTICMASVWATIYYTFLLTVFSYSYPAWAYPVAWAGFIFAVAGLNWIISELTD